MYSAGLLKKYALNCVKNHGKGKILPFTEITSEIGSNSTKDPTLRHVVFRLGGNDGVSLVGGFLRIVRFIFNQINVNGLLTTRKTDDIS